MQDTLVLVESYSARALLLNLQTPTTDPVRRAATAATAAPSEGSVYFVTADRVVRGERRRGDRATEAERRRPETAPA